MQVEPRSRARREFISALRNRVGSLLGRQRFLFLNAGLLTLGTATSSVFGFATGFLQRVISRLRPSAMRRQPFR